QIAVSGTGPVLVVWSDCYILVSTVYHVFIRWYIRHFGKEEKEEEMRVEEEKKKEETEAVEKEEEQGRRSDGGGERRRKKRRRRVRRIALEFYVMKKGERLPVRGPSATRRFCQKLIVDGRLKKKSTVGGRLRKKNGRRVKEEKKKKRRKNTSPAHRRRPQVARTRGRFLSCTRRRSVSPHGEKDRGDDNKDARHAKTYEIALKDKDFVEGPLSHTNLDNGAGQGQVVTCSGAYKDGSLRIVRNGIGINEQWHGDFFEVQVLLATGGGHLVYLEIGNGKLAEVKHVQLDYEISCLDINPSGENPNYSTLAAVGMWTDISVRIFSLPSLELLAKENLGGEIIPRSVLLCTFEGVSRFGA
ncbi:hypothetical protein BHM03_00034050, partial [Ensete ventricosum]